MNRRRTAAALGAGVLFLTIAVYAQPVLQAAPRSAAAMRGPVRRMGAYATLPATPQSQQPIAVSPMIITPASAPAASFRNPGFEQLDTSGNPTDWNIFREAYIDSDPAVAHSGNSSIRSSYLFGWSQTLLTPCSPYETFAVAGYARSEFKFEMPLVRIASYDGVGAFIGDISDVFTNDAPDEYRLFWTALEPLRNTAQMEVYLGGASAQSWIRYDDILLYTEQFHSTAGEPGDAWEFLNGATQSGSDITLPQGASISQRVASSKRDNQAYFVAGRYTAPAPANVRITDTWLPPAYWVTTVTLQQQLAVGAGTGEFVTDMVRPNEFCYGQSKVGFAATTGGITLRDLKRGFARVDPTTFTVGANSPDAALLLTVAVPRKLASASIEIRDSTGTLLASPAVEMLGTAARAQWQPSTAASGKCTARFILACTDGQVIQMDRGFELVSENASNSIPILARNTFTRGAWLFFYNNPGTSGIDQTFALAKQDGFNFVMAHCRVDQLSAVRAAAELQGLPFIPQLQEVRSLFGEYVGADYFSKADYIARVRQYLAPVLSSPMYQGVYVVDEPVSPASQALNQRASLAIAQTADLKLPFAVLPAWVDTATLTALQPPVGMVDPYPFNSGNSDNWSWVTNEVSLVNTQVHALSTIGRDLWMLPQAFEAADATYFRGIPNTEHWAQLGAAIVAGARGVMPFTYSDGMRDSALQELPKLAPYRRFNALMDQLTTTIMQLAPPDVDARFTAPLAVSIAQRAPGEEYVLALNAHDRSTYTLELQFSPAVTTQALELVEQRLLPFGPGGATELQLGPGEWAIVPVGNRSISSFTSSSTSPPAQSTLPLMITHQFTVQDGSNNPFVPLALSFNDNADRIAVTVPFSYVPLAPRVYQLGSNGSVTRQSGNARFPAGHSKFVSNRLFEATEIMGTRIYAESAMDAAPVATFLGHSGGIYDIAAAGNSLWAATYGLGIRRIADGTGALASIEAAHPQSDLYTDILTVPGSSDAWVHVGNIGVDRVIPGQLDEALHQRVAIDAAHDGMAFNGVDLLAMPRGPKGVDLVRVVLNSAPVRLTTMATDAVDVAAVAWVYPDTLAVADSVYSVRFYRVYSNGSSFLLGNWRPDETSSMLYRSLASSNGKLAVGLQDGRVLVVNTNTAMLKTAATEWQWFH